MFLTAVFLALVEGAAAAESNDCPPDRTAVEMAGHRLCLLDAAMPSIDRREDGSVASLIWSYPERFPADVQLPPGTFYIIVRLYTHIPLTQISPSLEESEPSSLPKMRETTDSHDILGGRKWLHPEQARFNGHPFVLQCSEAILEYLKELGAHNCQLISQFASGIWLEIHLATVDWDGPAWPRLDETWVETWEPFLSELGTRINNLLSIQR